VTRFVEQGGVLITTDDLFQKNRDNVYLTSLPPFYRRLNGFEGNDFIYGTARTGRDGEEPPEGPGVFTCGNGKVIMLPRNASVAQWKEMLERSANP